MATRYRSHLRSAAPFTYETALAHFQTLHNNVRHDEYPMMRKFQVWLVEQKRRDAVNYAAHGATGGLVNHIAVVHNWTNDVRLSVSALADNNKALSNTDIGIRVDMEMEALFRGEQIAKPHNYTIWLIMYFYERGWMPCAFQVPLWTADNTTLRTKADIVIYDTQGSRFALIEQKTGYDYNYDTITKAKTAYDYFPRTRRVMCHLQLGWMYFEMARTKHPWPLDAFVVRVSSRAGVRRPERLDVEVHKFYVHEHTEARTMTSDMALFVPLVELEPDDDDEEEDETDSEPDEQETNDASEEAGQTSEENNDELRAPVCKRARCR